MEKLSPPPIIFSESAMLVFTLEVGIDDRTLLRDFTNHFGIYQAVEFELIHLQA